MKKLRAIALRTLPKASAALLFLQATLVVTGGAVRLTGSGLGCPTWPECTPGSYLPIAGQIEGQLHAWIEFGNRILTFVLVIAALATLFAVLFSQRRDLRLLAIGQVAGIFGQGILGGITVLTNLNPIAVASHFIFSTILIAAATSLFTRRYRPAVKKFSSQQTDNYSRMHIGLSAIVIALGTIVTGAGPHAGDIDAPRLHIRIQSATAMHGIAVALLLVLTLAFFLSTQTNANTKKLLTMFALLTFAQGAIGLIQYIQGVPVLLVATHLVGAVLIWILAWRIWLSVQREEMDTNQ